MRKLPFRLRLTLTNALVVFCILALFSFGLVQGTRAMLFNQQDAELLRQAERMSHGPRPGADGQGPPIDPILERRPNDRQNDAERPAWFSIESGKSLDGRDPIDASAFAKARDGHPEFASANNLRVVYLRGENQAGVGVVQFSRRTDDLVKLLAAQSSLALLLLPVAALISAVFGWLMAKTALEPVVRMTEAAKSIDESHLAVRLPVDSDDELGNLASTFNSMLGRIEGGIAGLRASLERQRRFVGDSSHELKTPLARLKLTASAALQQDTSEAELREALKIVDKSTDSMTNLVDQLLQLARIEDSKESLYPAALALDQIALEATTYLTGKRKISVTGSATGYADEGDVERILINLLSNADRATLPEGEIKIEISEAPHAALIKVIDNGKGIAPEHLPHLTERFFRVDQARTRNEGGTGLGLSICESLAQRNGGSLAFKSEVGVGTSVTLSLPKQKI